MKHETPAGRNLSPQMWTRAHVFNALELASAGSIVAGVSLASYGIFGALGSVAAGLISGGSAVFYLANAYSIGAPE